MLTKRASGLSIPLPQKDEISLPPHCQYCQDTGYRDERSSHYDASNYPYTVKIKCLSCSYWIDLYKSGANLGRHAACTLDNFDYERLCIPAVAVKRGAISQEKAEEWCVGEALLKEKAIRSYATNIREYVEQGKGLYLYGPFGSGKSHLAAALVNRACEERIPSKRVNEDEFIKLSKDAMDEENETAKSQLESLFNLPLLVIDEFCGSRHKEGAGGYVAGELQALIDHRYRERKATIYTSNFALENLVAEFKAGIISRIRETCVTIIFYATDYRMSHPSSAYYGQSLKERSPQDMIQEAARS